MDLLCRVCAHQVRRSRIDVGVWKLSLAFVRMPAKIGLNRYDSTIELQLTYVYMLSTSYQLFLEFTGLKYDSSKYCTACTVQ